MRAVIFTQQNKMKHFLINFFLNIFFILPNWALKVLTLRKEITYKNEVFDYQSMIYISLISWFITKFGFALDMSEFSDEMRKKMANLRIKINNNIAPKILSWRRLCNIRYRCI